MSTYDNIRSKIERADQHIQELDQAIREFMNNKPFRIVTKQDKNTGEHIMVIADARPIPAEWSILAGEAVHQLRSSLDHAICYMVERAGGKVTKRTQFPISTAKRADILKREEASMEGIPEVAAQVVRQFQPYVVFDPYDFYEHPLNVLRELSNTDKHRSLNLINLVSPEAKIKVGSSIRDCRVTIHNSIKNDAEILRFKSVDGEMDVHPQLGIVVFFDKIGSFVEPYPVMPTLQRLSKFVSHIVFTLNPWLEERTGAY